MKFFKHTAVLILSFLFCFSAFADKLKVGFVYIGPVGDHGWTYMHDQGRQAIEKAYGDKVEVTYMESVKYGPDAERAIRGLAKEGMDIIFATSFGYMEPMLKVAKEFPNIKFEHATGYKTNNNMSVYSGMFYQGRYVQGVIAGHMSKTGKAGYIASFPIPEVVRGINAFYLGAKSVNPDFDIDVVWVNSWYDPVKEGNAAKVLISEGADIITQHTDSPAALQVAQQQGVYAFGQASNMYQFAPKAQLTAILDDWAPYYIKRVGQVMDGSWKKSDTWGDMKSGMVKMAPYTNMPNSIALIAKDIEKKVMNGEIDPFDGKYSVGELLGMNKYVKGIDASLPE
jgi:basic membrane protein A and related proteins